MCVLARLGKFTFSFGIFLLIGKLGTGNLTQLCIEKKRCRSVHEVIIFSV